MAATARRQWTRRRLSLKGPWGEAPILPAAGEARRRQRVATRRTPWFVQHRGDQPRGVQQRERSSRLLRRLEQPHSSSLSRHSLPRAPMIRSVRHFRSAATRRGRRGAGCIRARSGRGCRGRRRRRGRGRRCRRACLRRRAALRAGGALRGRARDRVRPVTTRREEHGHRQHQSQRSNRRSHPQSSFRVHQTSTCHTW